MCLLIHYIVDIKIHNGLAKNQLCHLRERFLSVHLQALPQAYYTCQLYTDFVGVALPTIQQVADFVVATPIQHLCLVRAILPHDLWHLGTCFEVLF
jgi:hypothetical protein